MIRRPVLVQVRSRRRPAAVVFLHGFAGHPGDTWGRFPDLLVADRRLADWDVFSLGYHTSLRLDLPRLWSASPPLDRLSRLLATVVSSPPLDRVLSLAFVAHSMGGLLVQRALLDDHALAARVGHLALFGTPSDGLGKALPLRFLKRQLRDMATGSAFILDLRRRWAERFAAAPPFELLAVAGERDEFVPASSSLAPFPDERQRVVDGDHLEMVKPRDEESLSFKILVALLKGEAAPAGPWASGRVAVELRRFHQAIAALWPHRADLDDAARSALALALESVGRREDAIRLLAEGRPAGTDVLGVLAGRLKRRWLVERRWADAEQAIDLYRLALGEAEGRADHVQAYYHAINLAFLALAYRGDAAASRDEALAALHHSRLAADGSPWRLATEGEAYLLLGEPRLALERYRAALAAAPPPREVVSMYWQAVRAASALGMRGTVKRLRELFRPGEP